MNKPKLGEGATPGPWHTKWNGVYGHTIHSEGLTSVLAVVSGVAPGITTEAGKANTCLIAKAPLLVEARDVLADLLGCLDNTGQIATIYLDRARALIAKLEG